jgi:MFS family permease
MTAAMGPAPQARTKPSCEARTAAASRPPPMRNVGATALACHAVSATPSRWHRALRAVAVDAGLLRRRRDYRLLMGGQVVSLAGSELTLVAIMFQTFQLTESSLAVGLLGVAEFVPILVLALVGGALADAFDRRRLVMLAEAGSAVVAGALLLNAVLPEPRLWVLYAGAALMAAFTALRRPPFDALIPQLVARDELKAAAAIDFLGYNSAVIAGPAAAGLLIAGGGVGVTYAVDVATFLLSLIAMRAPSPPADAPAPSWRSVREGVRYAGSRQELLGTYLVDMNAVFFGMPLALFPAIAERYGGPEVLGLMYAAPAVGSVLAALASGWTRHVHRHGRAVTLAAAAWGGAIAGFGLVGALLPALAFLALAGAMDSISGLFRTTIWNETIPEHLRGRLAGIEMLSYASGPTLGNAEAGAVAALAGVRASVVSGGALCVLGSVALALALPRFWAYDARSAPEGPPPPAHGVMPSPPA